MNEKQLGVFKIDEDLVRSEPEKVARVLAIMKAVPVRAEVLFAERKIEYIALSEVFDETPVGTRVPEYELTIEYDSSGWPCGVIVQNAPITRHASGDNTETGGATCAQ